MSTALQTAIVYLLVAGCTVYALHKLLPRALKAGWATGLARQLRGGSAAGWRARLATRLDAYALAGSPGCGGCDGCGTPDAAKPAGTAPDGQPIHWIRRDDR